MYFNTFLICYFLLMSQLHSQSHCLKIINECFVTDFNVKFCLGLKVFIFLRHGFFHYTFRGIKCKSFVISFSLNRKLEKRIKINNTVSSIF